MSSNQSTVHVAAQGSSQGLLTGYRWLTIIVTVGILIQAILASQGFFDGQENLITGHGHLGNALFLLVIIQAGIAFYASSKGFISRTVAILNALIAVLVVAQIGLGYSTRENFGITAWHISNGVLLMGLCAAVATLAWTSRTRARE